jgi:hypothetical protein
MKQILAIFAKDARRFWPEILVSFALLLAFVLVYPNQWRATEALGAYAYRSYFGASSPMGLLANAIVVLIPISWWILIARVIHGERLVGDTQFWLTRPYEWPKFLAAKLLFIAAFLCLPLLLAQSILLGEAGFNPFSHLPGLGYNLILVTGIFILPLAAFSTVTTGFGRMTLILLGVVVFIAGLALLSSVLPSDTNGTVSGPFGDSLSFILLACGCAAVVLVQFAIRKVRVAWMILAGLALLMTTAALLDPDEALVDHTYPSQGFGNPAPVRFSSYAPDASLQPSTNGTTDKGILEIAIPVHVSGVADGHAAILTAFKATIEAAGQARWESPWQVVYNETHMPGNSDSWLRFRIRRAVYDRFKSTPVKLHLSFAVDDTQAAGSSSIPVTATDFSVPNFGICTPRSYSWLRRNPEITGISCRSAMRHPRLTYVTAQWTDGKCSDLDSEKTLGTAWTGSLDSDPAEFGITSVWTVPLTFSNNWGNRRGGDIALPRHFCPGSPITFTAYNRVARGQVGLTIQDFHIPDLAIGDVYLMQMK